MVVTIRIVVQFGKVEAFVAGKTLVNRMTCIRAQFNDLVQLFIYLCNQSALWFADTTVSGHVFHGD